MSGLVRVSPYDRTSAVPPRGDEWFPVGADQPTVWPSDNYGLTTFVTGDSGIPVVDANGSVMATFVAADNCIYSWHSWLALRMLLNASFWQVPGSTTNSRPPLFIRRTPRMPVGIPRAPASLTSAQEALAEIRAISALTNEEIAPLAGVSRRSIQAWVAGESISARKAAGQRVGQRYVRGDSGFRGNGARVEQRLCAGRAPPAKLRRDLD